MYIFILKVCLIYIWLVFITDVEMPSILLASLQKWRSSVYELT
jgi:hypothetical protein